MRAVAGHRSQVVNAERWALSLTGARAPETIGSNQTLEQCALHWTPVASPTVIDSLVISSLGLPCQLLA